VKAVATDKEPEWLSIIVIGYNLESIPGRGNTFFVPTALKHARSHVVPFSIDLGKRFLVGIPTGLSV
jgi:hypothetical protein